MLYVNKNPPHNLHKIQRKTAANLRKIQFFNFLFKNIILLRVCAHRKVKKDAEKHCIPRFFMVY